MKQGIQAIRLTNREVLEECDVVLTESSKFGQILPSSIDSSEEISVLFTDKAAPKDMLEHLKSNGVEVFVG